MRSVKVDRLLRLGIGLLSVVLVYVLYATIHQRVVVAGDTAPDFSVTTDEGRTISVHNFGGKLLILHFWASWCQPCVEETPSLSAFTQQFADKGVVVLGISVDQDINAYQRFVQQFHPAFLTARDSQVHQDYGTFIYPETYFIDSTGRVLRKLDVAGIDWMSPQMISYVKSIL
jgi:cytochrome c biogenesis protein CcmG, thiol:disulfide interchange protein DsbE